MSRDTTRLKQRTAILDYIVRSILERKFAVGDKIYSENFVAERLQVSRAAVHEVFASLEMMGVVRTVHGGGTYLRSASLTEAHPALQLLMFLPAEDEDVFFEFRQIVELGMSDRVISSITDEQVEAIRASFEKMRTTNDPKIASRMDIQIHTDFCKALANPLISLIYRLAEVYITYISEQQWARIMKPGNRSLYMEQLRQHERIVQALEARDAQACRKALSSHLDTLEKL